MRPIWQKPYDDTLGRRGPPGTIGPLNQSYGWRDPVWWRTRTAGSTMLDGIAADVALASIQRDRRLSAWKSSAPAPVMASLFSGQLFAALRSFRAGKRAQAAAELRAAQDTASQFLGADDLTARRMVDDVSAVLALNYDFAAAQTTKAALKARVARQVRAGSIRAAQETQARDNEQTGWLQSGDVWAYAFSRPDNAALSRVVKGARDVRKEVKEGAKRAASMIPPKYRVIAAIAAGGFVLWQGRRIMMRIFG